MDAVLAVSMLAMVSAVAWADWVISSCGVSFEAMFQILDGQIRKDKVGRTQKWLYLGNCQSDWAQIFTEPSRGYLLCCGALTMVSRSWWCHNGCQYQCNITKVGKYSHIYAHITTQIDKWHGEILPFVFPYVFQCPYDLHSSSLLLCKEDTPLYGKQSPQKPEVINNQTCFHAPWIVTPCASNCGKNLIYI